MKKGLGRVKPEVLKGIRFVLARSQTHTKPYFATVLGREFLVKPGVFSPAYYAENPFFTSLVIKELAAGDKYLDVGCGVGVTAVFAALSGAEVTALDLNPIAVAITKDNAARHGVAEHVRVLESNVYSALGPEEKFDVIYWNTPFCYVEEGEELTMLERAVFDPGYLTHAAFIRGAKAHLTPRGKLLIGFSRVLGDYEALTTLMKEAGFTLTLIGETLDPDASMELPITLELYLARPR